MTWIKFLLCLSGVYLLYYAAIISWDLLRNRNPPDESSAAVITFEDAAEPVKKVTDDEQGLYNNSVLSSGGVSLRQLFTLARADAVEFTRPVSFNR
ncbi:hypothetical protein [Mucilaginibacter sp. HD30]